MAKMFKKNYNKNIGVFFVNNRYLSICGWNDMLFGMCFKVFKQKMEDTQNKIGKIVIVVRVRFYRTIISSSSKKY